MSDFTNSQAHIVLSERSVRAVNPPSVIKGIKQKIYRIIARELDKILPFFDEIVYLGSGGQDSLLPLLPYEVFPIGKLMEERGKETASRAIVLNGIFNSSTDIQAQLEFIKGRLCRADRVIAVIYNPYFSSMFRLADRLGWRRGEAARTFVTEVDLNNLAKISGYDQVRLTPLAAFPFNIGGIGKILDFLLRIMPILKYACPVSTAILRPVIPTKAGKNLSVVIPARNERGNIQAAIERLKPYESIIKEIIFVEGHSSDDTWQEIALQMSKYAGSMSLSAYKQQGKGKADAVRLGFSKASGEILTILDADLTMPPELLHRFYDCYVQGHGDFVNGSRLVYPMDSQAMRFLNRLGNLFFAKSLSFVLSAKIGDSLCGTKLLSAEDYKRMTAWRNRFGDFDPFGDFELLFPAALLGLGVVDVPIKYRDRVYGSTNISRFKHGFQLLRMTLIGLVRIKGDFNPKSGS